MSGSKYRLLPIIVTHFRYSLATRQSAEDQTRLIYIYKRMHIHLYRAQLARKYGLYLRVYRVPKLQEGVLKICTWVSAFPEMLNKVNLWVNFFSISWSEEDRSIGHFLFYRTTYEWMFKHEISGDCFLCFFPTN